MESVAVCLASIFWGRAASLYTPRGGFNKHNQISPPLVTRHTTYNIHLHLHSDLIQYTLCHTRSWIYTSTLLIRRSCKCIEHHRWAAGCGSSIQLWRTLYLIASSIYIGVSVWQTCSDGGYLEEAPPVMELVPSTSWGLRPHAASLNFVQLWK